MNEVKLDLTTAKAVMENDTFAIYVLSQILDGKNKDKYNGIRVNKKNQDQTKVVLEKTNLPYPPYRVVDFVRER